VTPSPRGERLPSDVAFATTNAHKVREAAAILAPLGVRLAPAAGLPPVEETGETFLENATLKAVSAARALGRPALAEDSGLVVPGLGGEPGVRSARYAGARASDAENNARLVARVEASRLVDPPAHYVCAVVLAAADGRVLASAEGRVEGTIRTPPRGSNGFGYDPLFHYAGPEIPAPGRRFAELTPAEKDAVSHRGRAFRALSERIAHLSA
jgi:XTP/dITP diphosphohydrolase